MTSSQQKARAALRAAEEACAHELFRAGVIALNVNPAACAIVAFCERLELLHLREGLEFKASEARELAEIVREVCAQSV